MREWLMIRLTNALTWAGVEATEEKKQKVVELVINNFTPEMKMQPCPVCGERNFEELIAWSTRDADIRFNHRLRVCNRCGCVYKEQRDGR